MYDGILAAFCSEPSRSSHESAPRAAAKQRVEKARTARHGQALDRASACVRLRRRFRPPRSRAGLRRRGPTAAVRARSTRRAARRRRTPGRALPSRCAADRGRAASPGPPARGRRRASPGRSRIRSRAGRPAAVGSALTARRDRRRATHREPLAAWKSSPLAGLKTTAASASHVLRAPARPATAAMLTA